MSHETREYYEEPKRQRRLAPATCSAALLKIIKTCEDYQNADCEGVDLEKQCDDAYRTICKVIVIANGRLAELKARQNDQAEARREKTK